MNLFVLDTVAKRAAQALSDQHVNKMILETAQILDGGTRPVLFNLYPEWSTLDCDIVKIPKSHRDNRIIHSVQSRQVWQYAIAHFYWLLEEFQFRYEKPHAYCELVPALQEREGMTYPHLNDRGFVLAMPDAYKVGFTRTVDIYSAVTSYRRYYAMEKMTYGQRVIRPSTWTLRPPPPWLIDMNGKRGLKLKARDLYHYYFEAET